MLAATSTHNPVGMLFLLFTVGIPFIWIIVGSVAGKFDQKAEPKRLKSQDIPLREERAGYVENKIKSQG